MSRKFDFNKNRVGLLAGLIEEDDYEDVRHSLAETYHYELIEDVKEVDSVLKEYSGYMGYKPNDSEGEQGIDCECPEKAKPMPEESGLPGWSYYDADPTYAKISTMKHDLQHKRKMQWVAPTEFELEEMEEESQMYESMTDYDAQRLLRSRINKMITEHVIIYDLNKDEFNT